MMSYKYTPSPFMLETSHYDKAKADRAVAFIQNLCHTKGKWAGKKFLLLSWQEQIVRDLFGIVKEDGKRQFLTAYVEIPKKQGKSELAAALALYLLYADNEPSAEVYGAACDRSQASIVFDVAKQMVQMSPALLKRSKITAATKRIVNYSNAGFYQVLSAETGTKHGLNVSGLVFDEIHAQPNRKLYDVLTKGSGDAREQPLFFIITTAGTDKNSICYELHTKAMDIKAGRKKDHSFYPIVYGLTEEDNWNDEKNWYKANPSLGHTISIDRVREAYKNALENPAEENVFKQLRLNIWTSATVCWIPEHIYSRGDLPIDLESLNGRECYGGLDLSSTSDITALVLVFPPRTEDENYIVLPFFWLPKDTLELRCRRDHVLYDVWELQGYIQTTEGNVIHYGFIEKFIEELGEKYHIKEIAFDRWNATQMVQNLEDMGFTVVPFGQGYKDMSPPSKELYKLLMEGKMNHGGHPVLKWMAQNVVMRQDPAGNIKPDKEKSVEKIDGIVATIMALDRCIRNKNDDGSVYDERGILSFQFATMLGCCQSYAVFSPLKSSVGCIFPWYNFLVNVQGVKTVEYKGRSDEDILRDVQSAGQNFLGMRLGDMITRIAELDDKGLKTKLIEEYYRNQDGYFDKDVSGTRVRVNSAVRIIRSGKADFALKQLLDADSRVSKSAYNKAKETIEQFKKGILKLPF